MEFDLNDQGNIGTRTQIIFLATKLCLDTATVLISTFTELQRSYLPIWETQTAVCFVLDIMSLKRMLEKLGQAKTHLELKKILSEVTGGASKDTINYHDFLNMMLGKRNAILKLWV